MKDFRFQFILFIQNEMNFQVFALSANSFVFFVKHDQCDLECFSPLDKISLNQ